MAKQQIVVINASTAELDRIGSILTTVGPMPTMFSDPVEALAHLREHADVDLVITDLHTPRIDGWRFCQLLRSEEFIEFNHVPILVTSAVYSGYDVRQLSRDIGANEFLSVPCGDDRLKRTVVHLLEGRRSAQKPVALIIEDDGPVARLIMQGLKEVGFHVFLAESASAALPLFESENPDVILLDHHLPDSVGLDLIPKLKLPGSQTVIIVITGDLSSDLSVSYMSEGAHAFVRKPFDIRHLVNIMDRARRQRALLRIEELLTERSAQIRDHDARVAQASKLASLGELAAGIAHEINNPINGIMNCAEILVSESEPGSSLKEFAEIIQKEGIRVAGIVRRLAAFTRQSDEDVAPADCREIMNDSISMIDARLKRSHIETRLHISESLPLAMCRRMKIQQAFLNILINACDALDQKYPDKDSDKLLLIAATTIERDGKRWLQFVVEDHGGGIHPSHIARLWDPLFTTKKEGTGLGLAIVNSIITEHGGKIEVESKLGQFSKFRIWLQAESHIRQAMEIVPAMVDAEQK